MLNRQYVVRAQRPWLRHLLRLALLVGLVAGGHGLHQAGLRRGQAELVEVRAERDVLLGTSRQSRAEVLRLRAQLDGLARGAELDDAAYGHLRAALQRQQAELLGLREELAFYRGIAVSTDEARTLGIQSLQLVADEREPDRFRYAVVLTRVSRSDKLTRGQLEMQVEGRSGGEPVRLDLGALGGPQGLVSFQFRHYHRVQGRLTLPAGFEPERIVVAVTAGEEGSEPTSIERSFDWPRAD